MSLNIPSPLPISGPTTDGVLSTTDPVQIGGVDLNGKVRKLLLEYSGPESLGVSAANITFSGRSSDAFGRGRVSSPTSLFDVSFEYDAQPLIMQTVNVGAGTSAKTANVSSVTLSTGGNTSGDGTIFQSKQYSRYESGKSQLIQMTGVIGAYKQSVRSQLGYYDSNNGVFFDMDGTSQGSKGTIALTVRSHTSGSSVDTQILQPSWNLDKMDGTGTSGYNLDFTKAQIFVVDFQWLGEGRIRFGFAVNGRLVYCHQIQNANIISLPWSNTGSLPVRWEIHNTGTASGTTTMTAGCASVISEGGTENPAAVPFSASNGITTIAVTTRRPILSIQVKTTFNSIVNRSLILLEFLSLIASTNPGFYELVYNGTLTGASFNSVDANSGVNFDVAATAISNGTVFDSGFVSTGAGVVKAEVQKAVERVPFTLDAAGTTGDIISLVVTSFTGTCNVSGQLNWTEDR